MEAALWYVLAGTRCGTDRVRILRALEDDPRNADELAETLELNCDTVRHHLNVLVDNGVLQTSGDDDGAVYLPSDRVRGHWDVVESIIAQLDRV